MYFVESFLTCLNQDVTGERKQRLHFLFHDLDDRDVVACKKIVRSVTLSRVRRDQTLVFLE